MASKAFWHRMLVPFAATAATLFPLVVQADQIKAILQPLAGETATAVEVFEIYFEADVELHRLTVGVEAPDGYTGTMNWVNCGVGTLCSNGPSSIYSTTYLTVDPDNSFADDVAGKLFLTLEGAELGLTGALVTPPNWGEDLHCLARLELSVPQDSSDPPVMTTLIDEDMASIDWTIGDGCTEPMLVDADPVSCSALVGFDTYTEYVSTIPDDQDADFRRDEDDNCVYKANLDQSDLGGFMTAVKDGVGDACQCGEGDGSGQIWEDDVVLGFDQANMLEYLRGGTPMNFAEDRCSLGGNSTCTIYDAALLDQGLNATGSVANECTAFTN
ncbi:MAG: hypothetical protein NZ990_19305 [Myxococcota bacterium]|nr:hypothetical protein [Myxococcota bacterium]